MEIKEQLEQIVRVGREMRRLQDHHARTNTSKALRERLQYEKLFDDLLKQCPVDGKDDQQQAKLFRL